MPKTIAIILFGGSGTRFSRRIPKQFVEIGGRPLMTYTAMCFSDCDKVDEIYVVSSSDYLEMTKSTLSKLRIDKIKGYIVGGESRQDSVFNALDYLNASRLASKGDIVLIHDGARPSVSKAIIEANIEAAKSHPSVLTGIRCTDTAYLLDSQDNVEKLLPRERIVLAQTPQSFEFSTIFECHRKAKENNVTATDDITLVNLYGFAPFVVQGSKKNIKITTVEDIEVFLAYQDE